MSKKLFLLAATVLLMSGCGADYEYQVTYQPIRTPENQNISLETLKPIIENRLSKSTATDSAVAIENNQLVVSLNADIFDIAKAGGLGAQYDFTLEEPREALTQTEVAEVNKHNQAQKDMMQQAYNEAKNTAGNIDAVVINYSEQSSHLPKGIRGPYNKAQVKEELYWNALVKTDIGQVTDIIAKPDTLWFAKVLEKNIADPNNQTIKYQQIIRTLERPEPYLGYVPVSHLGQYITKAEVIKKDPDSTSNKNYAVKVTFNEEGKSALAQISQQYQGKTLRFAIDKFPYAKLTITTPITDGVVVLDDDYNQTETTQLATKLNQGFLPVGLSIVSFTQR